MENVQCIQSKQNSIMNPHVPKPQLQQLLIFCHYGFICFFNQPPTLPKTPNYYNFCCWFFQVTSTLMYTNVNSVILTNEYSHITCTPVTMQNTFISPECSLMSPPSYSERATSLIFHFWLFLSGLELHINETILL